MGETNTAYTRALWPGRSNSDKGDASIAKWGRSKQTPHKLEVNTITGKEDITKNKYVEDACHD